MTILPLRPQLAVNHLLSRSAMRVEHLLIAATTRIRSIIVKCLTLIRVTARGYAVLRLLFDRIMANCLFLSFGKLIQGHICDLGYVSELMSSRCTKYKMPQCVEWK